MISFLYGQTEYNMLKNSIHLADYISVSKKYGYSMLSITDDNMAGNYKFYKLCKKNDILPLIGLEISLNDINILLYALDNLGYSNLCNISSLKECNGVVNIEDLYKYQKGIYFVLVGNLEYYFDIKDNIDNLAIGVQYNDINAFNFAKKHDIMAFPISEVCYLYRDERIVYETLCKIGNNKIKDGDLYLKNQDELKSDFSGMEVLFDNLDVLKNMVSLDLSKRTIEMPKYQQNTGESSKEYLHSLCYRGLEKRLQGVNLNKDLYKKRLDYELSIIDKMGYDDYFLIVWDFIKFAKNHGILIGPGRGSGAGSLVAYSIGITSVDPIKYNLLFERFLNPERVSMPDIDTDIADNGRDEVISYVHKLYGDAHVCYIAAFDTFKIKSSIRDLGRVLTMDEKRIKDLSNQITKKIDENLGYYGSNHEDIKKILEDLMSKVSGDDYKFLFIASRMEGLPRHVSTHAAGIIMSAVDLASFIPLQKGMNNIKQAQLDKDDLEEIGLLKMDFLSVRNLSIIDSIMKEVGGYNAINLYNRIPLDDKKTYDLFYRGETLGIFQFESDGITRTIMKLHPDRFEDIVAVLALYRPGPMENIDEFISRKNGKKFGYIHKDLKDILSETYGIIVYQEQIMLIAQKFAGYSLGEADVLRRAVSKKKEAVLIAERDKFVKSSIAKGYDRDIANKIYDDIVKFANYGFNKSHSVAYSLFSYVMAYFKANYPTIFVSKILNNVIGTIKDTVAYLAYAKKCGLKVLPPSVNYASNYYVVHGNNIFIPFNQVKGVGIQQTQDIILERKNGMFKSFNDFKERVKIQSSSLEALIYSGAFDEFRQTKKSMLDDISGVSMAVDSLLEDRLLSLDEIDDITLSEKEKKYLGFNLKYSIFDNIDYLIRKNNASYLSDLKINQNYKFVASFVDLKELTTKNNELMLVGSLNDGIDLMPMVIFPKNYTKIKPIIKYNKLYIIEGRTNYDDKRAKLQVIVNSINLIK